jgi:hypothetical protein
MPVVISGTNGITNATWTTATRPSAPSTGQMGYNTTINVMEFYNGSAWVQGGGFTTQSVQTTGFTAVAGNIYPCNTTSAAFTVTLPASPIAGNQIQIIDYAGTFATNAVTIGRNGSNINGVANNTTLVTNSESVTFIYIDSTQGWKISNGFLQPTAPNAPYSASYLIVAGGGGGASQTGGAGGAGGLLTGSNSLSIGTTYSFVVGAGGGTSTSGSNSTGFGLTAIGGGGGSRTGNGGSGGSGGGAGGQTATGGSGTSGQGNAGGNCQGWSGTYGCGGGGGAGAAGSGGTTAGGGGNGGIGVQSSITGTATYYAGGGGGGRYSSGSLGTGGLGGGGASSVSGTANTGGGGGGAYDNTDNQGSGGSGVVILSVPTANYSGTTTGSPTVTTSGSNTIIKFTASGSYTA